MEALQISTATVVVLVLVAFAAGWVDAVVGGGGLLQLPALLIALPDSTPTASILGTNKVSSVWGTATSSVLYAIKVRPEWQSVLPLVVGSSVGSALGAQVARFLPREVFTPIVLVALVVVGIYTWRRPELGLITERRVRRSQALPDHVGDRSRGGGVRRDPRPGHRLVLRHPAGGTAGLGLPGGQRPGQDREPGHQPVGHRGVRRPRRGAVAARADDGCGQPGRGLPGCPDRHQQGKLASSARCSWSWSRPSPCGWPTTPYGRCSER